MLCIKLLSYCDQFFAVMCKALILLGSILKIMRGFYLKRMPDSEERTFIEFCKYHQLSQ